MCVLTVALAATAEQVPVYWVYGKSFVQEGKVIKMLFFNNSTASKASVRDVESVNADNLDQMCLVDTYNTIRIDAVSVELCEDLTIDTYTGTGIVVTFNEIEASKTYYFKMPAETITFTDGNTNKATATSTTSTTTTLSCYLQATVKKFTTPSILGVSLYSKQIINTKEVEVYHTNTLVSGSSEIAGTLVLDVENEGNVTTYRTDPGVGRMKVKVEGVVGTTVTLRARVIPDGLEGWVQSDEKTWSGTILTNQPDAPTFTVAGGKVEAGTTVSVVAPTDNALLFRTGSTIEEAEAKEWTEADGRVADFTINGKIVIQAISRGVAPMGDSEIAQAEYYTQSTGLDEVETAGSSAAEYYNLQGIRVAQPVKGGMYIRRTAGAAKVVVL